MASGGERPARGERLLRAGTAALGGAALVVALAVPPSRLPAAALAAVALLWTRERLSRPPRLPSRRRKVARGAAAAGAALALAAGATAAVGGGALAAGAGPALGAAAALAWGIALTLWAAPAGAPAPSQELWRRPLAEILARPACTRGATERWIEVPWAADRLPAGGTVLDIGHAHADPLWHEILCGGGRRVFGADLARRRVDGVRGVVADVRALPFATGSFDAVVAISTVEHVGRDNTRYGVAEAGSGTGGDLPAMEELARVLRPGGCALVTVPFGRAEDHGWFHQYDAAGLARLAAAFGGDPRVDCFAYAGGWARARPEDLGGASYGAGGAPAASAVACLELRR